MLSPPSAPSSRIAGPRSWHAAAAALLLGLLLVGCHGPVPKNHPGGAVSAVDQQAVRAGEQMLSLGGNAADAATAVGFALAVVHPQAGNLGGGGFLLYYNAERGQVRSIDFREEAPTGADRDMFLDEAGQVVPDKSTTGTAAVGVPGSVAGLLRLHRQAGRLPLERVMLPAIRLAEEGFTVSRRLAEDLEAQWDRLDPAAQRLFGEAGRPLRQGETLKLPRLAAVLKHIRQEGEAGFYQGWVADALARYMANHGGLLSARDLASYRAIERTPIHFRYRDAEVYSMGLPSSGGIVLRQILGMLEFWNLQKFGRRSPELVHLVAEASLRAFADRAEWLGDPRDHPVRVEALLRPEYLRARARELDLLAATPAGAVGPGHLLPPEPTETTHFAVVDKAGNAVSITTSLNYTFGGGTLVPELELFLNNHMDDFAIRPGHPNLYGLVGGRANAVAPCKRPLSSMSPSLVFEGGQLKAVLGARGGPRIISSVLWAIIGMVDFDLSLKQAVKEPRSHHQWLPDELVVEPWLGEAAISNLIGRGHGVVQRTKVWELHGVGLNRRGRPRAVADPRYRDKTPSMDPPLLKIVGFEAEAVGPTQGR